MYNTGDRICHVNEGSFWYVEILGIDNLGIICNIIGFQNKNLNTIENNYFMKKETMFLNGYIIVTSDLEKEMVKILFN